MEALPYEYLSNRGLSQERLSTWIGRSNARTLNKLAADLRELLPQSELRAGVPYQFLTNSQLSGGIHPCSASACRVRHVLRMSRFAALYADHVAIQNPLPPPGFARSESLLFARDRLLGSISALLTVQPLVEAGLLSFYEPATRFCEHHAPSIIKSGRLEVLRSKLYEQFAAGLRVQRDLTTGWLRTEGPESLIEHAITTVPAELRLQPTTDVAVDQETKDKVIWDLIGPIIVDILQQHVYGLEQGVQYLTDREIDLYALTAASDSEMQALSYALQEHMTHVVPTLDQLSVSELLELRRTEGEAFAVYRDALAKTVRSLTPADVGKVAQAFNDAVLPELNKIDATIASAQRRLRRSTVTDLLIGAGVVTASVFSGLLSPDIGNAVAQLGGAAFGMKVAQRGAELLQEPAAARDSSYYFLWKARELARLRSRREPMAT